LPREITARAFDGVLRRDERSVECRNHPAVAVQLSDTGPHASVAGDVTEAWSASVPAAAPGPVNRPANEKVNVPVTAPLRVTPTFVNGANVPSALMANRVVGRIVTPGVLSVPLGVQGMLKPKVMFVRNRPSLVTSKLTAVPRVVAPA
jgi:hypothetical protein